MLHVEFYEVMQLEFNVQEVKGVQYCMRGKLGSVNISGTTGGSMMYEGKVAKAQHCSVQEVEC